MADDWATVPCDIRHRRRKHAEWASVLGPIGDLWFLHRCNEMKCWEPRHIYAGTPSQNVQDSVNAGTRVQSFANPALREAALKTRAENGWRHARGYTMSEEGRANISTAKTGKPNGHLGRKHSPETIARMRESARLREARKREEQAADGRSD